MWTARMKYMYIVNSVIDEREFLSIILSTSSWMGDNMI